MPRVIDWMPAHQRPKGPLWSRYASREMSAGVRSALLDHLRYLDSHERGLLANARCLSEGIDVPALDGVAFIDPRRSEVDIVQAGWSFHPSGRGQVGRDHRDPRLHRDGCQPRCCTRGFGVQAVWDVIRALRAHDDELGEQLDGLRRQLGRQKRLLRIPAKIHLDLPSHVGSDFIEAFNVHLVDQTTASWEFWFGLLQRFVEREGHARVRAKHEEDGYRFGSWVTVQRHTFAKGQLAIDRATRLEAIPGWVWDERAVSWEEGFEHLLHFVEREGHARVPGKYEDDGYGLGSWVSHQRNIYRKRQLTADRVTRLESLPGWAWNANAALWEQGYEHLLHFVESEGHARVPRSQLEDDVQLGQWVAIQRGSYAKGQLAADRVTRLEALGGWVWDVLAVNWDESFERLRHFVEREGHTRIPETHLEDGYQLRRWVAKQRRIYATGQLAADRVSRLESLPGWFWDPHKADWEEGLERLRCFVQREKHSRVPTDYEDDGYRLGQWVTAHRQAFAKGQLAADRSARLQAHPGWVWDVLAAWDEGFQYLLHFVEREGHAHIPVSHVEDGYRLGRWVNKQRTAYENRSIAADRLARLEPVPGWVWNVLGTNWREAFERLLRFVEREGHGHVPGKYEDDGYRLGSWVIHQRNIYRNGQLAADRVAGLEALPGWVWNSKTALWEEGFSYLGHFVEREGHAHVPWKHREDDYRLGQWVSVQRGSYAKGQITADRVTRLESLPGWVWKAQSSNAARGLMT